MASAENSVQIKVSFSGREQVLPLSVRPSLELPDSKVDVAEEQLNHALRQTFGIEEDAAIYLHEAVTKRILSKETFRDPAYCEEFPRHWYLVVEKQQKRNNGKAARVSGQEFRENNIDMSTMGEDVARIFGLNEMEGEMENNATSINLHQTAANSHKLTNGPTHYDDLGLDGYGYDVDDVILEGDDAILPTLEELSLMMDTRYQSHTLHCSADGEFGLTLRHFSIQPNAGARSETPRSDHTHSRSDSMTSTDSLDSFRLTTTFIHDIAVGGVAEEAGMEVGLAVQQINGESILRSSGEEIQQLVEQCGEVLSLLVLPKENDDLQCLYPHYTYGEPGTRMTDDGLTSTVDIPVTRGTGVPTNTIVPNNQMTSSNNQSDESGQHLPSGLLRLAPPTGLVPFDEEGSQELSLGPDNLHSTNSSGDFLLEASLSEIVMREEASIAKLNNQSRSNYDNRNYENVTIGYTNGEVAHGNGPRGVTKKNNLEFTTATNLDLISEDAPTNHLDSRWYHDSNDSYLDSLSHSLAQEPPNKVDHTPQSSVSDTNFIHSVSPTEGTRPRTRSQSSLQKTSDSTCSSETHLLARRTGLTGSMSALDYLSLNKRSHSTDLGVIRIKKKGRNSLEALTKIGLQPSLGTPGSSSKVIKRHRSDENTHRIKPFPQRSVTQPLMLGGEREEESSLPVWMLHSPRARHKTPTRQQSQASDEGLGGSNVQLSGGSNDQQVPACRPVTHSQSSEGKGRKGGKSYQSQRARLHSKTSSAAKMSGSQELTDSLEHRVGRGRRSVDRSDTSLEGSASASQDRSIQSDETIVEGKAVEPVFLALKGPQPSSKKSKDQFQRDVPVRVSTVGRQHSLREAQQNSLILRSERERRNRPFSAVEQEQFRHAALENSNDNVFQPPPMIQSNQFGHDKDSKIPLFKTRSAQTPYGTQVIREVNIEEAIARSQMTQEGAEPEMTSSSELAKVDYQRGSLKRKEFGKKVAKSVDDAINSEARNLMSSPLAMRLSTEVLATLGLGESSDHFRKDIKCHGVLSKKLDITENGKRASDRTWRAHYAVLAGSKLLFYKDKRDAVVHKPSDEPPIDVVPSTTTVESSSKKKFVFRIVTAQGAEFLLQADDAPSFSNWVTAIQKLNIGLSVPNESFTSTLQRPESSNKLAAPNSPILQRRSSSPQPGKTGGKKKDMKFMNRLRRVLTGQRPGDQPDSSSFLTFGQSLEDCPVSADNKRVPLVVEFCVREVEEHGLEVEGIYRKPGQVNLIKSMSAEMDKGNYDSSEYGDIHTVGSLLKKFFKELPDPLVPVHLYDDFVACAKELDEEERLTKLKDLVYQLPTAHYHTLKFLMRHLKKVASRSDENKMTYRNVSIVFGPTLLFKPEASQDVLANMNASYIIVQLLCQHVEHLFSSELCGEEQRMQEEATELMKLREEEIATRGSPTTTRHSEAKVQKEQRLAKASPQAVRRIKNNLTGNERVSNGRLSLSEAKRNSLIEANMTLQPKQHNWTNQPRSPTRRVSEEYLGSSSGVGVVMGGGNSRYQPQQQDRRQKVRRPHVYEDVESPEMAPPIIHVSADSHARTRSWVESHNERLWASEDVERSDSAEGHRRGEMSSVGSLWASRNRPDGGGQPLTRGILPSSSSSSKERRQQPRLTRLGGRGHLQTAFAPPPMTVESDILGSSYSRAASLPTSHLTAGVAGSGSKRSTPGSIGTPTGHHKISYGMAVGISPIDIPDKDASRSGRGWRNMDRKERFASSERYTASTGDRVRSRGMREIGGGDQGWQGVDTGPTYATSPRSHTQQGQGHTHRSGTYARQYNSLQRQLSPPQLQPHPQQPQHHYSSSRRSSESSRDAYIIQDNQEHYTHYGGGQGSSRGNRAISNRTYSNDQIARGQRGLDADMCPNSIPNRESYL